MIFMHTLRVLYDLPYRLFHKGDSRKDVQQAEKLKHAQKRMDFRLSIFQEERPDSVLSSTRDLSHTSLLTHPQPPECLLFRLPLELRIRIYDYLYADNLVIFRYSRGARRFFHYRLDIPTDISDQVGSVCVVNPSEVHMHPVPPASFNLSAVPNPHNKHWTSLIDDIPQYIDPHNPRLAPLSGKPLQNSRVSLALLQTCHAVCADAVPVLYNRNVFSISSPQALLDLHDYLLPTQNFSNIRHLNLFWPRRAVFLDPFEDQEDQHLYEDPLPPKDVGTWNRYWAVVGSMDLQSLSLWLELNGTEEVTMDSDLIRPLMQVKGIPQVGVKVERYDRIHPWIYDERPQRLKQLELEIEKCWTDA